MKSNFPDYAKENAQKERSFMIGFYNMPRIEKIRDLKTRNISRLLSIYGTVTRTTEVKPELQYGTFKCLECN
jgi:DNA replication licensing factor MCM6